MRRLIKVVGVVFLSVVLSIAVLGIVSKVRNRPFLLVLGQNKVGYKLSSSNNLTRFVDGIVKKDSVPFMKMSFYDYVPKEVKMYRRLEPEARSPVVFGCSWKKNSFYWSLNFYGDKKYLGYLTEKDVNLIIGACVTKLFAGDSVDIGEPENRWVEVWQSINGGVIFTKNEKNN